MIMCSEFMIMSEISCLLWSSVCEYQSVECAFTSPVSIESGMFVTCRMQHVMSVSTVLLSGDVVSLGGKYVFATVMSWVLPMCILINCISVLMALSMFMFVKVMVSLISVMSPLLVCTLCLCVWWCTGIFFWCFSFLCEFCFLYCDEVF